MKLIDSEVFRLELLRDRPHVMIDDSNGDTPWRDSDYDLRKILSDSNAIVEELANSMNACKDVMCCSLAKEESNDYFEEED